LAEAAAAAVVCRLDAAGTRAGKASTRALPAGEFLAVRIKSLASILLPW
jgi:hypothetical protein